MKKWLISLVLIVVVGFSAFNVSAFVPDKLNSEFSVLFQNNIDNLSSGLKIYPNPVTGKMFRVSATKSIIAVHLNNILGQKADVNSIKRGDTNFEINLKNRKQGIYLVTVIFEDKSKEVKRLVIN
jgi:hypothetical protein